MADRETPTNATACAPVYAPPAIEQRESIEALLMPVHYQPGAFPGGS